jgi:acyl phosphate:glycerol-3-phosphate acyltransferase
MIPGIVVISSYFFGSLPFGLMIAKWWKGIDVREHGSGNIGATNVYRVVGRPAGVVVFILDVLKGLLPPLTAHGLHLQDWWIVSSGFAAILGHNFSPFLGVKGGKGVSTSLGVLFGVAPKVGITAWTLWGIALGITGYVSVGSILAAAALAPLSLLLYPGQLAILAFCLIAGAFSIVKHRGNIVRLLNGTENSVRRKSNDNSDDDVARQGQEESEGDEKDEKQIPHNYGSE